MAVKTTCSRWRWMELRWYDYIRLLLQHLGRSYKQFHSNRSKRSVRMMEERMVGEQRCGPR
jgi:hypothetical protein